MDEKVKQILMGVGALSELWTVTYKNFLLQGFNHGEAIEHTSAFMQILIGNIGQK